MVNRLTTVVSDGGTAGNRGERGMAIGAGGMAPGRRAGLQQGEGGTTIWVGRTGRRKLTLALITLHKPPHPILACFDDGSLHDDVIREQALLPAENG